MYGQRYRKPRFHFITGTYLHVFLLHGFAGRRTVPPNYIVITFGLNYQLESPRIEAVSEPYPNRWTHHVLISDPGEIDKELMGWIKEADAFIKGAREAGHAVCRFAYLLL